MSKIDEQVWQARNGIIQRLNNPEGLQEEEVDTFISLVQEQQKEKIRKASHYTGILGSYATVPTSFLEPTEEEPEHDEPPDPMEEIADKYF